MKRPLPGADRGRMRIRLAVLLLALLAVSCGDADPAASDATTAPPTTAATTTTSSTTTTVTTTEAPESPAAGTFREEWRIETNRGEIIVLGEHTPDADRWVESYGSQPGAITREVITAGDEAWSRYAGVEWEAIDQNGIVNDLLNGHPFEVAEVVADFELVGTDVYEDRDVMVYSAVGPIAAGYSGIDASTIVDASAEVSIYPDDTFATYTLSFERNDGEWVRLTYRTFDFGAAITIDRPEVIVAAPSCRDRGKQLIDEVGSYRSRYDLLHPGAAFSSIEQLRLLDPWAWQTTVNFVTPGTAPIVTLWVDGGYQYWRNAAGEWVADTTGEYQTIDYRPFVDDLWLPTVVETFSPVGQAEVAGRMVDVYELGLEDIRLVNEGLADNTDTLSATMWIEPCSSPALIKMEVKATGRGYAEGEYHVIYEIFDIGTSDTIDIPPEALER